MIYPKKVRDEMVAVGEAQPHHILPETGWVSFYLREVTDVQKAIELLKRSYHIAMKQHKAKVKDKGNYFLGIASH